MKILEFELEELMNGQSLSSHDLNKTLMIHTLTITQQSVFVFEWPKRNNSYD
jgi:hypothetical protein